eukprot:Gregarina_sp_Poly_1__2708@NODE_1746_length_3420_cov_60_070981_g1142_i0_p1_GENE_NODE_1746_length_3420_cov_60_070981_g1142_i0NODE_1746_length_3420_cov_60_070981_g1142_i0_p1_ORF_typecomplete_len230_score24_24_NODE_1746_length_3420_cov_60_070981_g1142_i08951584
MFASGAWNPYFNFRAPITASNCPTDEQVSAIRERLERLKARQLNRYRNYISTENELLKAYLECFSWPPMRSSKLQSDGVFTVVLISDIYDPLWIEKVCQHIEIARKSGDSDLVKCSNGTFDVYVLMTEVPCSSYTNGLYNTYIHQAHLKISPGEPREVSKQELKKVPIRLGRAHTDEDICNMFVILDGIIPDKVYGTTDIFGWTPTKGDSWYPDSSEYEDDDSDEESTC